MLWCLATLAPELGFSVVGASIDHGLRPAAQAELDVARRQAAQLECELRTQALALAPGANLQARARAARYRALRRIARREGANRIAVGHTMDDQAETVLMRLLRGGSVRGASGIAPRRADGVIRPLIDCRRHDVHALARERFEQVVQDPSNRDERFERVRVRFEVLPLLESENVAVVEHLAALADDARLATSWIARGARRLLKRSGAGLALNLHNLRRASPAVRREALRMWLRRETGTRANRAHLYQLDNALIGRGEVWLPDGWVVRPDADGMLRARRGPAKT
jgi:tRNA(Ile)-lysidine synthase